MSFERSLTQTIAPSNDVPPAIRQHEAELYGLLLTMGLEGKSLVEAIQDVSFSATSYCRWRQEYPEWFFPIEGCAREDATSIRREMEAQLAVRKLAVQAEVQAMMVPTPGVAHRMQRTFPTERGRIIMQGASFRGSFTDWSPSDEVWHTRYDEPKGASMWALCEEPYGKEQEVVRRERPVIRFGFQTVAPTRMVVRVKCLEPALNDYLRVAPGNGAYLAGGARVSAVAA